MYISCNVTQILHANGHLLLENFDKIMLDLFAGSRFWKITVCSYFLDLPQYNCCAHVENSTKSAQNFTYCNALKTTDSDQN